jgi:transposase InsO family protein
VHVYIDDVILCSKTHDEHLQLLDTVFKRFHKFNLKCKLSKLQLGAGEVNYLGYNISRSHGIRAGAAKIEAVRNWKQPTSVTEIKQFLGLCSFFRRTIPNFATIASSLTRLTRKDAKWSPPDLPSEAAAAFEKLKSALCSRPCLAPVNFDKEFILTTDASSVGIGAILSQIGEDGDEHPCAYGSRVLTLAEQKWAPTHLEHLAMVWGCRQFRPYLAGRHFTLRTDHKPLVSLNRIQGMALERLRAELDEYRPFTVEYLKGEKMPADGLSRQGEGFAQSLSEKGEVHAIQQSGVSEQRNLPTTFTIDQLYYLQKQDKESKALAVWLKFKKKARDPGLLSLIHKIGNQAILRRGVVFVKTNIGHVAFAPAEIRNNLLFHSHNSPLAGHRSHDTTFKRLSEFWYWPGMRSDIEAHCKSCPTCLAVNTPPHSKPAPMGKLPTATEFNHRVHIDLLGMLPLDHGNKYLLVMQDAHTKWVELCPITDKSAESAANAIMTSWITRHGCMQNLISDQGREFVNKIMSELCNRLNINHQTTSAHHPQANGLVERTNRTILNYLRKYLEGNNDWVELLQGLSFAINTSVHTSTGYTPFQAVYGRRPIVPFEMRDPDSHSKYSEVSLEQKLRQQAKLQKTIWQKEEAAWQYQKQQHDKNSRVKKFSPGDIVYVTRGHTSKQLLNSFKNSNRCLRDRLLSWH